MYRLIATWFLSSAGTLNHYPLSLCSHVLFRWNFSDDWEYGRCGLWQHGQNEFFNESFSWLMIFWTFGAVESTPARVEPSPNHYSAQHRWTFGSYGRLAKRINLHWFSRIVEWLNLRIGLVGICLLDIFTVIRLTAETTTIFTPWGSSASLSL